MLFVGLGEVFGTFWGGSGDMFGRFLGHFL